MLAGGFHALCSTGSDGFDFSTFRLSRVSECLARSYLAVVKLLFLPSPSDCRRAASAGDASSVSSSSAEPDDLVRIETGDRPHPSIAHPAASVNWRGRGGGTHAYRRRQGGSLHVLPRDRSLGAPHGPYVSKQEGNRRDKESEVRQGSTRYPSGVIPYLKLHEPNYRTLMLLSDVTDLQTFNGQASRNIELRRNEIMKVLLVWGCCAIEGYYYGVRHPTIYDEAGYAYS